MIAILFGVVFVAIGLWKLYSRHKFFKKAIIIQGVITGYKSYRDDGTTMYTPIATFEFDGQKRECVDSFSSSWKPTIGKLCKIGVNPNNIEEARIYSTGETIFWWVWVGIAVISLLAGIFG